MLLTILTTRDSNDVKRFRTGAGSWIAFQFQLHTPRARAWQNQFKSLAFLPPFGQAEIRPLPVVHTNPPTCRPGDLALPPFHGEHLASAEEEAVSGDQTMYPPPRNRGNEVSMGFFHSRCRY